MSIISLADACNEDSTTIGPKVGNLAKLMQAGLPVPSGWVIPAQICREHFAAWGINDDIPDAEIYAKVQDGELTAELLQALARLPDIPLAVRSSAALEDGTSASYSGVFETVLGVKGHASLTKAVRRVWASLFSPKALAYHRQVSKTNVPQCMAVLIMPMIDAHAAGVAFSAHPVDGNPFVIAVSANYGLGTTVVDGKSQVDCFLLGWDTLAVRERQICCKTIGEFLGDGGHIQTRGIDRAMREKPALDDEILHEIGGLVREVDSLFNMRIDMEFAVSEQGIAVLQARPVVNLPPYFPDDPRLDNKEVICCHQERMEPLTPYAQAGFVDDIDPTFPLPPWPMELCEMSIHHGRAFGKIPNNPELTDCPESPWEDRSFIKRMLSYDDPNIVYKDWYEYADVVYGQMIPSLRARSEHILRMSDDLLHAMSQCDFADLVDEAVRLDREAGTLYLAGSYPTYETLRRIDVIVRDCLSLPWQQSQQVALTMIQGAPKLTHLRDAEIEQAARDDKLENVIAHWGYSFLRRDDLLDIATWRSWREDTTPLDLAVSNLRKIPDMPSISERVQCAADESDVRFGEVLEAIRSSMSGGESYEKIFAACVRASRRIFPLKDDRDLVLSHAQSAVRLVLCEAGRRLVKVGVIENVDDIFLLHPDEIVAVASDKLDLHRIAVLVRQRETEQRRLARYTMAQLPPPIQESLPGGEVFQGEPANAGVAEGPVRIISTDHPEELAKLQPGEILWLRGEGKVGWTMYFPIIAGLIYCGNWLCHETNLCRELGIPAVTGVRDIPAIRNGDLISIDGGTGTISFVR